MGSRPGRLAGTARGGRRLWRSPWTRGAEGARPPACARRGLVSPLVRPPAADRARACGGAPGSCAAPRHTRLPQPGAGRSGREGAGPPAFRPAEPGVQVALGAHCGSPGDPCREGDALLGVRVQPFAAAQLRGQPRSSRAGPERNGSQRLGVSGGLQPAGRARVGRRPPAALHPGEPEAPGDASLLRADGKLELPRNPGVTASPGRALHFPPPSPPRGASGAGGVLSRPWAGPAEDGAHAALTGSPHALRCGAGEEPWSALERFWGKTETPQVAWPRRLPAGLRAHLGKPENFKGDSFQSLPGRRRMTALRPDSSEYQQKSTERSGIKSYVEVFAVLNPPEAMEFLLLLFV